MLKPHEREFMRAAGDQLEEVLAGWTDRVIRQLREEGALNVQITQNIAQPLQRSLALKLEMDALHEAIEDLVRLVEEARVQELTLPQELVYKAQRHLDVVEDLLQRMVPDA